MASTPRVTVYHAAGCHLCERALAQVRAFGDDLEFELEEVAIDGDPELEARYRELIPVVEIEGDQVFTYYVHEQAFRRRLEAAQTRLREGGL
ncbi:MAG: glutaredoxin family protein [Gaiellaceae bacterium]